MSGKISDYENTYLSGSLEKDITLFKEIFKKDAILRVKRITRSEENPLKLALIYMDGMVDTEQVNDAIIRPVLTVAPIKMTDSVAEYLETEVLFARDVKRSRNVAKILEGILYGEALLLIDKSPEAITADVKGWRTRGISEPEDERILQGPREGFEEAALLNIAMLRRRLQTPDLCTEMLRLGRRTNTIVFICYLDTLTDAKMLDDIKKRIKKIDIDGIIDSNYITEQIKDYRYSPFKTTGSTERPDIVAARLLEGRIAIIVDGSPVVVTIPYLFSENFQSDEDYYINFLVSNVGRIIRYICFMLAISLPAIFIAVSVFHRELLPTSLAIAVSELRAGVPFSPLTECLILIFIFEVLRETGIRMPQSLGHALSIVGGLVVGQAAVDSRIISAPILIIIALSGISGLMVPRLKGAVFYLRIVLVLLSSFLGLYGYMAGISVILMHILSLNSFGTDYTVSLRRINYESLKDTIIRAPWNSMKTRPLFNRNKIRMEEAKKCRK
ncbi:MAG: spore germination protein [Clostridia bacterium]|nr:spore germination protein [Clostridia bacterium]